MPEGVPLSKVLSDVLDSSQGTSSICDRTGRRFLQRHSDLFHIDKRNALLWVEPKPACYTTLSPLRPQYASDKTDVREGGSLSSDETGIELDDRADVPARSEPMRYAKEKTQDYLSNYLTHTADSVKSSLLKQFATDKAGTEDKYAIFKRIRGQGRDYLCLPHKTRYNDIDRATSSMERLTGALNRAGDRHTTATMLTLTTDPKRHSGLSAALDGLSYAKGRLLQWLSTDYQLGSRPENLTVLEFTRSGVPHVHVVLFGVSEGSLSIDDIEQKWSDSYGQGTQVHAQPARTTHNGARWVLHDDSDGTVSLRHYLSKAIRELQEVAKLGAEELRDRVANGDLSLWRQALYWATERQYVSHGSSLREETDRESLPPRLRELLEETDRESLPEIKKWEFVGTAKWHNIPAHVRRSATFTGEPPP